jgi:hypothetical protein
LFAAQGYVHEFQGDVTGSRGVSAAQPVRKDMNLENNTTITTGAKSYAVLKFEDGTVVVLKENSAFQVQDYRYNAKAPERSNVLFNLARGGLRMITGLISSKNRDALKVATPTATIGIRGTEFLAELVNPLIVQVVSGVLSVTNAAGVVTVAAGQVITVPTASALGTVAPAGTVPGPNIPNVPTPPAVPGPVPPGPVVGGVLGGVAPAAAALGAAAAAAAAAAAGKDDTPAATVTHQ